MTQARQRLGRLGERLAADRLVSLGYTIVERNYRCPHGELDIVARHADCWVFIEVRTRRGARFGSPEQSITPRKRGHLIAAAQHYLQAQALDEVSWRIDVVAVALATDGQLQRLDLIANAITG